MAQQRRIGLPGSDQPSPQLRAFTATTGRAGWAGRTTSRHGGAGASGPLLEQRGPARHGEGSRLASAEAGPDALRQSESVPTPSAAPSLLVSCPQARPSVHPEAASSGPCRRTPGRPLSPGPPVRPGPARRRAVRLAIRRRRATPHARRRAGRAGQRRAAPASQAAPRARRAEAPSGLAAPTPRPSRRAGVWRGARAHQRPTAAWSSRGRTPEGPRLHPRQPARPARPPADA